MNADDIRVFFGQLLKDLYKIEGQVKYKLWAKKDSDGNVDTRATELKAYNAKAEEILPRDSYIGRGSGGPNIGNKLKVVSAHLLRKLNIDHNEFAESVPSSYRRIEVNFESYDELLEGSNLEAVKATKSRAAKAKVVLGKQAKRPAESSDDEETPKAKKSRKDGQAPRPRTSDETPSSGFSTSSVLATGNPVSLRPSHQMLQIN